ncbi:MAG: DUF948 domain-containing protein [bacterium]
MSQMDIFFIISSIGFVSVWIFGTIVLVRLARILGTFRRIADGLEKNIENIGDSAEEMVEDVRDSTAYRLLFGKKRRKHKKSE